MIHPHGVNRVICIVLSSFLMLAFAFSASLWMNASELSRFVNAPLPNTVVQPQLLNANTNPTLRFPIAWASQAVTFASYGWLDISRDTLQYTVTQPPQKAGTSFSALSVEIRELKLGSNNTVTFRIGFTKHTFFYVSPEKWGTVRGNRGLSELAREGESGTESIYKTMMDFGAALALVESMSTPAGPRVRVPDVPASPPYALPTPITAPAIAVVSPSGAGASQTVECQESPLVIRGVATDNSAILMVSINGSPANMRPQNTQSTEFWSNPLPLRSGDNHFRVSATTSAHVETNLDFTVHYMAKAAPNNPRALGKAQIISLLQGSVPPSRVADIVKDPAIKFTPTADDLKEIRAAGGDAKLIQTIQQAATSSP